MIVFFFFISFHFIHIYHKVTKYEFIISLTVLIVANKITVIKIFKSLRFYAFTRLFHIDVNCLCQSVHFYKRFLFIICYMSIKTNICALKIVL